MKEKDRKVRAAIAAAVTAYIKEEAEMAAVSGLVAANRGRSPLEQGPFARKNKWGEAGRHSCMQLRTMIQLKAFR